MGREGSYLHQVSLRKRVDDILIIHEEEVIDTEKGIRFKHYHKENNKINKTVGIEDGDNFIVKTTVDGVKAESVMSKADLLKSLSKDKEMKFVADIIKTLGDSKRKQSRTTSKKTSKKSSKKTSKKTSRRTSRRTSRTQKRTSKRGSKRKGSSKRR